MSEPSSQPASEAAPMSASASASAPPAAGPLPEFIEPMLAKVGKPFDDDAFLFEVKWDGTRGLAFVAGDGSLRLLNRRRRDITWRYPELSFLAELPAGTVLDGEVVCLDKSGRPNFQLLQSREQAHTKRRALHSVPTCPATYVVFDQLYEHGQPIMNLPCSLRRERLRATVAAAANPKLVMSEGITGGGLKYFEQVVGQGLEGVIAKRLDSPYEPGRRSGAWVKIKRHETVACVVIGYVPEGTDDFGSLIIATQSEDGGALRCVGRVGTGFDARLRATINAYLYSHPRPRPVIACDEKGRWVEPGLYCTVRCMERTADGHLRAPVFGEISDVQDPK